MIRCLIVDDEPLAREILEQYVADTPGMQLLHSCSGAMQAIQAVREHKPDVLFLDIQMPRLSGVDLVKMLPDPPLIVFTTGYPDYAVEGFNLQAADYLLKPISFERFLKTVHRLETMLQKKPERLLLRADKKIWSVPYPDVLCVEAGGDYMVVHCTDKRILVNERMKHFEETLPAALFVRVHKSWIINKAYLAYIEGNTISLTDGKSVPIGKTYRGEVEEKLL